MCWVASVYDTVIVTGLSDAVTPFACTRPVLDPTVAIVVSEDDQFDRLVTFSVPPFVRVAVAVYCLLVFCASFVVPGVIAIDTTDGRMTVAEVLPVTLFFVAVIKTDWPATVVPTPVASPVGVIKILVVSDDDQVTLEVMSRVEPSLKVPAAVNCC